MSEIKKAQRGNDSEPERERFVVPRSVPYLTYLDVPADSISSLEMSSTLISAFEFSILSSSNLHSMHLLPSALSRHPAHSSSSYCYSSLNSSCSSWTACRTGAPLTFIITGVTIALPCSVRRSLAASLSHDLITIGFLRLFPLSSSLLFTPF